MPGASYPKPDGEKRTRHEPQFGWTNLPADGCKVPPPDLPELTPEGRTWSDASLGWWQALWAKPQATQWDRDDASLYRLVAMRERFWRGEGSVSESGEMRQIEDRHGLNSKSMLQLRWRIGDPDDETPSVVPARARRKASERQKAALTVVDGGRDHA